MMKPTNRTLAEPRGRSAHPVASGLGGAITLMLALGGGCDNASRTDSGGAHRGYEYAISSPVPPASILLLTQAGGTPSRLFADQDLYRFALGASEWLHEDATSIVMRAYSPCTTKDWRVQAPDLDRAREQELRKVADGRVNARVHVTAQLETGAPKQAAMLVWVDWGDTPRAPGKVTIGSLDLATIQTATNEFVYALFDVTCTEGRTVRIDGKVVGTLTPKPNASGSRSEQYLVTTLPNQCYRISSVGYGRSPGEFADRLPGPPQIHPLPDIKIDYFLVGAPSSVAARANGPDSDVRGELVRTGCEPRAK